MCDPRRSLRRRTQITSSLLDKSLLRREEVAEDEPLRDAGAIHEYARERLDKSGEAGEIKSCTRSTSGPGRTGRVRTSGTGGSEVA